MPTLPGDYFAFGATEPPYATPLSTPGQRYYYYYYYYTFAVVVVESCLEPYSVDYDVVKSSVLD